MRSALDDAVRDLFGVWRDTRLIVLVAQTAAIYAAVLIPFKVGIPLIPGFAELRPANALPIVASLLFGPPAAWGAGFGNLIGDCFGTLSPASAFGFLGNFLYGYVPYLLWGRLGPLSSGRAPEPRSWRQVLEFAVVCAAASLACALVIGWGADLLGLVPFEILATAVFFNNLLMAWLLAPPLLLFLSPRVTRWGLRYEDITQPLGRGAPGARLEDRDIPGLIAGHPGPTSFVDVRAVSFMYRGATAPALRNCSLSVDRGEAVVLMGKTGAGKTTLCYTLNGLIPQSISGRWEGRVIVDSRETSARPVWKQAGTVGVLFQDFETQLISTNLLMEMAFPLEHASDVTWSPAEMRARIVQTLAGVGLSGLERRDPLTLSGGQRQRLALATILARRPTLLVLDEPFTDLDPNGRRELSDLLRELKRSGSTVLVAEHDPEEAALADRVCVLEEGRVAWLGPPRALFGRTGGLQRAAQLGVAPLPLAECFDGLGLSRLPLTVEEAWGLCEDHGVGVSPDSEAPALQPRLDAPDAPAVLEVEQAGFAYDDAPLAVQNVTLTIREGEFVAIVGQNGSGKSTLAGLLKALRHPTRGRVLVRGRDTRRLVPGQLATMVGYVFQNPDHQIFAETVDEEVSFGVRNLGYSPAECDARVSSALDAVGLGSPEVRGLDPFSMTKGDRQRIAVASVLAERPRILIFDEPSTGLDGQQTQWMMRMIRRLNEQGHTIVMITHAMSLVAGYARRCVVMRGGRIEADGPTREVFARLLDPDFAARTGLHAPPITRFAARWGHALLTVEEVKQALRKR